MEGAIMQSIRTLATAFVLASSVAVAAGAFAQMPMKDGKMGDMKMKSDSPPMADGEVRRVDKDAGKITLRHGPIKMENVDMEPMTMVFQVKDKAMLDTVKTGDKVKFRVVDDKGRMTVTEIRPAQ
jgi:Cu(I)/Ag(I) efflux system protein CusF